MSAWGTLVKAMPVIQAGNESGLGRDGCSADRRHGQIHVCWRQSCQYFMRWIMLDLCLCSQNKVEALRMSKLSPTEVDITC